MARGYLCANLTAFSFTDMFATNEEEDTPNAGDASHSEILKGDIGIGSSHETVEDSIHRREINNSVHLAVVCDHGYPMHAEL